MGLMDRVSQLMTSDIGRLLDRAERPEVAIERLIGDIEESIVELRREMVTAVVRQGRLRRQLAAGEEAARRIEGEASLALASGENLRARHVLGREIGTLKARDTLEVELAQARRVSARLVAILIRMEDRVQLARRTQDDLVRRRRGEGSETRPRARAAAGGRIHGRAGVGRAFDGYAEAVGELEREASSAGGDEGGGRC